MARLDIGVGQDFPLEEKPRAEDRFCSRRDHHHNHFHQHKDALREMWRRHFGRSDTNDQKKDKE